MSFITGLVSFISHSTPRCQLTIERIQLLINPDRLYRFTTALKAGGECDGNSSIGQLFATGVGDLKFCDRSCSQTRGTGYRSTACGALAVWLGDAGTARPNF